ncbi:putative Oleoyl-(acyl-carrier-protein) hydrolase [Carnobacterium maltaromaticum]|uniref:amino acid adenylation domain-containing protein n=1 Tax=Carnobacterium maltaromaticum TaxID=2751 RepID=UPI00191BA96C|nr:amino acid adenylation domain-containing protein [Carnobacterium maltaromaticum]CAD5901765.1 putative Oleoyl-(acyl-carrier-protein) hydrolase [Carnobacterium maltaromaticum]
MELKNKLKVLDPTLGEKYLDFIKNSQSLKFSSRIEKKEHSIYQSKKEPLFVLSELEKGEKIKFKEKNIIELIEVQAEKNDTKIAIECGLNKITYGELISKAKLIAASIGSYNLPSNSAISIYLPRSIERVATILGVLYSGNIYQPVSEETPKQRILDILDDLKPKMIIVESDEKLGYENEVTISSLLSGNSNWELPNYLSDDLAYIIYTSGSTGKPKGVKVGHIALLNFIKDITNFYKIKKEAIILQFASIAFDVSVFDLFASLSNGAKLIIATKEEKMDPSLLTNLMREKGVTVSEIPPALLPNLDPNNLPQLELLSVGGEKVPNQIIQPWVTKKRRVINGYGPTEATVAMTFYEYDGTECDEIAPIGLPIANVEVYVLDEKLNRTAVGEIGELYVSGICLSDGYVNDEKLTNSIFVDNPFSKESSLKKMYKTGDLVSWNKNGFLTILGRNDRQVKIRGHRIELSEIEKVVDRIPEVLQNKVIVNEKKLFLFYVEDSKTSRESIKNHVSKQLPNYMIPEKIIKISKFPLTSNGKIDTNQLIKLSGNTNKSIQKLGKLGDVELEIVQKALIPVLGKEVAFEIDSETNFFDIGGNSLQATEVSSIIRKLFAIEFSVVELYSYPKIADMSELVKKRISNSEYLGRNVENESNEIIRSWCPSGINHETAIARVVLFPYAGASKYVYKNWYSMCGPDIELITINLPGRDERIREKNYDRMDPIANRISEELKQMRNIPTLFFGQSGGALLAFEVARRLEKQKHPVSGIVCLASRAAHDELSEPARYYLNDSEFLNRVDEFGGIPEGLRENRELLNAVLPSLRADEKFAETYKLKSIVELSTPIDVWGGKEDFIPHNTLKRWFELTKKPGEFILYNGGHFFAQDDEDDVIENTIKRLIDYAQL